MAKVYPVSVPMPDLSNVYALSRSAGRNTGYNNFASALLEHKRDMEQQRLEERLKANSTLASSAKSGASTSKDNDDDDEGFFGKLDDFYYNKIQPITDKISENVFDVVSRPSQASSNALGALAEKKEEGFLDKFSDTGDAVRAFWKGLKGEGKYKTTASVIAEHADRDKDETMWDNTWLQAGAGFVGDVALDPTTYMGIGLISKPAKALRKAPEGARENAKLSELSEDIAKLDVTTETRDIPLKSDEIYAALGGTAKSASGRKGRKISTKAAQARHMRIVANQLPELKNAIRRDPNIKTEDGIAAVNKEIENLKSQRKASQNEAVSAAYKQKLDEFDNDPKLWRDLPKRTSLLKDADRSIKLHRTAKAFKETFFAKTKKDKSPQQVFDDILGEGWKQDARISPEFRATALDTVNTQAWKDVRFKQLYKSSRNLNDEIKSLREDLKIAPTQEIKDHIAKRIEDKILVRNRNYDKQNIIKAALFHKLARNEMNDVMANPVTQAELGDLELRAGELQDAIMRLDNPELVAPETPGSTVFASGDENLPVGGSTVTTDRHVLQQELDEINEQIVQLKDTNEFLPASTFEGFEELKKGMTDQEWDEFVPSDKWVDEALEHPDVQREINIRAEGISERLVQTKLRREREESLNEAMTGQKAGVKTDQGAKVRKMFGNPAKKKTSAFGETVSDSVKTPRVVVNGKEIYLTDKKAIARHIDVTDEDIAKATERSLPNANSETLKVARDLEKRSQTLKRSLAKIELDEAGQYKQIDVQDAARLKKEIRDTDEDLKNLMKASSARVSPLHTAFERVFYDQYGTTLGAASRAKQRLIKDNKAVAKSVVREENRTPSNKLRMQVAKEAHDEAVKSVRNDLKSKNLRTMSSRDLEFEAWDDEAFQTAKNVAREEYAEEVYKLKNFSNLKGAELTERIKQLEKVKNAKLKAHDEAAVEAKKTREAMAERLDEQLLLNILEENLRTGQNYLRLSFAGAKIADIPTFNAMTKATEKLGGLPILAATQKAWEQGFKPASKIEPELNLARLRAMSRTPNIIKHHVDDIRHRFAKYKPGDRRGVLDAIIKGAPAGDVALHNEMVEYINEFLPYVTGKVGVGNDALKIQEINRFLPEQFHFVGENSKYTENLDLTSPQKMLSAMRRLPKDTDPMEVMWKLRIASEQALADKNLRSTIKETYGVKRELLADSDLNGGALERKKIIEKLRENHNWTTVRDMGEDYYFAPDIASDINKVLDMIKPRNVPQLIRGYDKATRAWKSAVTVYNPGYYTRNAIGEYIMSAFDGLTDPRWYNKAGSVIKYAMKDETDEALESLEPWVRHQTMAQKGARPVMTMKNGKTLTAADVWVLYNDQGLKSGFISSEFDHYFPGANTVKATPVGRLGSAINDTVRSGGEKFEDFFRLSHFMYRMQKSGHTDPLEAAKEAAQKVRKFHFDYTDFTPFEKTTMMRLFPFYKWTRKAFPLMASMLFTQPGKVMIYPKMMQNISYGTGATDPTEDTTGFMPDYEEVTPQWMQNLMAYPIGRDEEGWMSYANMATPQFDVYKMASNPVGTAIGMLNPLAKVPLEQATGSTLDPDFDMELKGSQARGEHLARTTPLGSLLLNWGKNAGPEGDSVMTEPSGALDEKITSFLTGLGFYENNEKRQQGEQMRRNFER